MKRILFILLAIVGLSACTKAPINGELEGLWQLTRIETGTDTITTRQYWAFQLHLIQLGERQFFGRFEHKAGTLRVHSMVVGEFNNPSELDKGGEIECLVADSALYLLEPYGLYRLDTRFDIEALDDGHMRLRSDDACLHFRKY